MKLGPFTIHQEPGLIEIRGPEALLAQHAAALCRAIQPSAGLRSTYELFARSGSLTSRDVADRLGLKIANASNKLKALHAAGYLRRSEETDPTGGVVYVYSCDLETR